MPTSRPLVEGDVVVGIADAPIPIIGDAYYWQRSFDPNQWVVLTRFDLLECDEPAEPVSVKPKWSAPTQRLQPQQPQPERRTVEDILDLTTRGPLEALAALQIVKAEIARDLWQKETN